MRNFNKWLAVYVYFFGVYQQVLNLFNENTCSTFFHHLTHSVLTIKLFIKKATAKIFDRL